MTGMRPLRRGEDEGDLPCPNDRRSVLLALARAVAPDQGVTVPAGWLIAAFDAAEREEAPDEWLTVQQAAARARVSVHYMYRLARRVPFSRKVSHRVLRFSAQGLDEWIAARPARGHLRGVER